MARSLVSFRVEAPLWGAFRRVCSEAGVTASEVLRGFFVVVTSDPVGREYLLALARRSRSPARRA